MTNMTANVAISSAENAALVEVEEIATDAEQTDQIVRGAETIGPIECGLGRITVTTDHHQEIVAILQRGKDPR